MDYLKTTDLAQVGHGGVTGAHPGPAHHGGGGALSVQHQPLGLTTRALTQQRVTRPADTARIIFIIIIQALMNSLYRSVPCWRPVDLTSEQTLSLMDTEVINTILLRQPPVVFIRKE